MCCKFNSVRYNAVPKLIFPSYNATIFSVIFKNKYSERAVSLDSAEYNSIAANVSYASIASNTSYANLTNDHWRSKLSQDRTMAYSELVLVFDDYRYIINKLSDESEPQRGNFTLSEIGPAFGKAYTMPKLISPLSWLSQSAQVAQPAVELHIVHAFSRYASATSRIQLSMYYMLVVIAANTYKLLIIANVLAMDHEQSRYMVTVGDATASFLERPDPCTKVKCLLEDEKLSAEVGPSNKIPKADIESANSTRGDPTLVETKMSG